MPVFYAGQAVHRAIQPNDSMTSCPTPAERYFCFLGFFFSFWGLFSLPMSILPYVEIITAIPCDDGSTCIGALAAQWYCRERKTTTRPATSMSRAAPRGHATRHGV